MRVRHQLERFENDVGRAVAKRLLELVDDLPSLVGREALIGDRRSPGCEIHVGRPGDGHERLCGKKLTVGTVKHVEETVLRGV